MLNIHGKYFCLRNLPRDLRKYNRNVTISQEKAKVKIKESLRKTFLVRRTIFKRTGFKHSVIHHLFFVIYAYVNNPAA